MKYGDVSKCCERNQDEQLVLWAKADFGSGPERDGWAIQPIGRSGDCGTNVSYCPFCGTRLGDEE